MSSSRSAVELPWRKPVCVLLLLLCLPMLYLSLASFLSGVSSSQAEMFVSHWSDKREQPSEPAWQAARSAAERAVSLVPGTNGDYWDRLGRVYEWRYIAQPFGAETAEASRQRALEGYRASVKARPLWPHTWMQLAFIKLRLLQFDDEFDRALAQASELGPWRMNVQAQLAEIGMIAWPQLSSEQKAATWESLERTLRYSLSRARPLQDLAKRAGLYNELCAAVDPALLAQRKWCNGVI
ncbi:hypothetical protein GCM10011352_36060 [Marinobacterium zhoushanense]|uniref:DUF4034 domain-containing protein n=1 Tax=Marinobacterium zhoushanense TaxID=1679163 RepID=A0ABQ1KSI3_9GAMM|nr:VpsP family polysaccharide biosynthesis protein [Marinobacterium zhoushanense]GGC06628.1 hypothetical protein GCM10011352_36060 [Marinobacterium zhoushanense]